MDRNNSTAKPRAKKGASKKAGRSRRGAKQHVIHRHCAGIDIGSKTHFVAVDPRDSEEAVRSFGCLTPELHEMAQWLKACGVKTVAMESTGVYWVPVAQVLESYELDVCLVDARHARNVPGRKSDVQDCQWLQQLHSYGLLSKVFLPDATIQPLRSYWRQRGDLVAQGARQIHHMHKALELMNIQLHKVLSDVAGASGLRILRAIVAGERDPEKLVTLCAPNVKNTRETFIKALTGEYRDEHLFALSQALELYDVFQSKLVECDERTAAYMATLEPQADEETVQTKIGQKPASRKRRKNRPTFDLRAELIRMTGVDLTQIDAIDTITAFTVITEQGIDMSAFPTENHFSSHLGLSPNNRITGGRIKSHATRHVESRAATALRVAAQSLYRSKSALGAYYRRMRARLGPAKAITAAAHKLAKIIYRMLRYGEDYVDQGQKAYEESFAKKTMKRVAKQAKQMGCALVNLETGEVVS